MGRFVRFGLISVSVVLVVCSIGWAAEVIDDFEASKVGDAPPQGWKDSGWIGPFGPNALYEVVANGVKGNGVRCYSKDTAWYIYKDLDIETTYLSWAWKATKLPPNGDASQAGPDDEAIRIFVDFANGNTIKYGWDTTLAVGTKILQNPWGRAEKDIILESGKEHLGEWVWESRNLKEDYTDLWKGDLTKLIKIRILCDSDNLNTESEAYIDEIKATPYSATVAMGGKLAITWGKIKYYH